MDTRQRIIEEAISLFSTRGYMEVRMTDIADAVGIKAPSLYKHFSCKKEIFDAILKELDRGYSEQTASMHIDGRDERADAEIYGDITEDDLVRTCTELFGYFLHDRRTSAFRRMLTMGQFNDSELASIYTEQYFDGPLKYHTRLFSIMMENGRLEEGDPESLSLEFYAPIHTLLILCDRDPSREDEALLMLENHVRLFDRIHGRLPE